MLTSKQIETVLGKSIDILSRDKYYRNDNIIVSVLQLLFFKWLSDWNEKNDLKEKDADINFDINRIVQWKDIQNLEINVGENLTKIFHMFEQANPDFEGVLINRKDHLWINLRDETLIRLIEEISSLDFHKHNFKKPQLLGEAYENFIVNSSLYKLKPNINLFTPLEIGKLIVNLLGSEVSTSIYDPACGSGRILIEYVRYLKEKGKNPQDIQVVGQELDYELLLIAKINLFLHGVSSLENLSINNPLNHLSINYKKFDTILSHPPLGVKNREDFQLGNYKDYKLIQDILETLDNTGKAVMLVPHGVLFRSVEGDIKLREYLIQEKLIDAIIALPEKLLYTTKTPTAIVVFSKNNTLNSKKGVLFIDASHEYESNRKRKFLTNHSISKILPTYFNFQEHPGYSKIVAYEELKKGDYILDINYYVKSEPPKSH